MKLPIITRVLIVSVAVLMGGRVFGAETRTSKQIVVDFVAAFSRHDLPKIISMTHPEVEWLTVTGSTIAVESKGQGALANSLRAYFASCSTCRSSVSVSSVNGNFVAAVETATWQSGAAKRSQASVSVYELADGKVRRVWYYPAVSR